MLPGLEGRARIAVSGRDAETTLKADLVKRRGYFLPHWTLSGSIYHVVFRLRDSLPRAVLESFEEERRRMQRLADAGKLSKQDARRLKHLVSEKVEKYVDGGNGECLMKGQRVAEVVQRALLHFDGERYRLHAWPIMPNHVHAVIKPLPGHELSKILHSWKSYTAHEVNRLLMRPGKVWMKESYDHIIRSEASYHRTVQYVLDNPVRAGLTGWKWGGCGQGSSGVSPD